MNLDDMAKAHAFEELCEALGVIGNSVELKAHALREVIGQLAVRDCDCTEQNVVIQARHREVFCPIDNTAEHDKLVEGIRADERRELGIMIGMDDRRPAESFTRDELRRHIEWMEDRARDAGAAEQKERTT